MKKAIKTIALSLMLALLAISLTTGIVLAYFNSDGENGRDLIVNANEKTVTVNSESELLKFSRDGDFSQTGSTSNLNGGNRYTLVLGGDLTLTQNIFINSDIHLDLGGHILTLGDYSLTIEHAYGGTVAISNGTITNQKGSGESATLDGVGKLFVYAPNSELVVNGIVGDFIVDVSKEDSQNYLVYNSLYSVAQSLIGEFDYRAAKLTFSQVSSLTAEELQSAELYFNSQFGYFAQNNCSMVFGSIENYDLPLEISNLSSIEYATEVSGNLTNLTAKVSVGESDYSCTFPIKVVSMSDTLVVVEEGLTILKSYLSPYYKDAFIEGGKDYVAGYYLSGDILLPSTISELCNFSYVAQNENGIALNIISLSEVDNKSFVLSPTSNIGKLIVTVSLNSGGTTQSKEETLSVFFLDTTTNIRTNESVAREIVNEWYGSSIVITQDSQTNEYTFQNLISENITDYGLKAINYSLLNNSDGTYEIVSITPPIDNCGQRLKVVQNPAVEPNLSQTVMLSIRVVLSENVAVTGNNDDERTVTLIVPVRFSVADADSSNASGFLPYFNYFNTIFEARTALSTANSFPMPLYYGSGRPVIAFMFESENKKAIEAISFKINDVNLTSSITETVVDGKTIYSISCHEQLDVYINTSPSVTIASLVASSANWTIEIDKSKLDNKNSTVTLNYFYKTASDEAWGVGSWAKYQAANEDGSESNVEVTLDWTLCGVLQKGAGKDMPDLNLYKWVFEKFSPVSIAYTDDSYILIDWLIKDIAVQGLTNVSDWTGIEFLHGVRTVDLRNLSIDAEYLNNFSQMASLTSLNLSGCGLSDRVSEVEDATQKAYFQSLANAASLTSLNLSNNKIFSFDFLTAISTLQEVYVYSQQITGVQGSFYGTSGLSNYSTYVSLMNRGVTVYTGIADTTPIEFSDSGAGTAYSSLTNIIYQERLPKGVSIAEVYSRLSTDYRDYGLSTTYTDINGNTYNIGSLTISFGHNGDAITATQFYLRYQVVSSGVTYSMDFIFSVKRV